MKELQDILAAYAPVRQAGATAALAMVVSVTGSAYRRPGARMLVLPDGSTVGSISGGCLESDVVQRSLRVMALGQSELVTYDTTQDSDILFGVGLGCQGIVRVLIEPLRPDREHALMLPAALLRERTSGILATVYEADNAAPVGIGDRVLVTAEGAWTGSAALLTAAQATLGAGHSASRSLTVAGRGAEVFFELLHSPMPLLICGAGPDALPLVRLAKGLGWHVTVLDSRPAFAEQARFPDADVVRLVPREGLPRDLELTERTAAVVMTHNYLHDRALLAALLPSPIAYLGVLGPHRRTERLLEELRDDGLSITSEMRSRLHAPIGLDIGAETPEQIALAVAAEIQAVMTGRSGTPLRDCPGPIYASAPVDVSLPSPPPAVRPPCAVSA